MQQEDSLSDLKDDQPFLAGIVSVDIVQNSMWKGDDYQRMRTKEKLRSVIEAQVGNEEAELLVWQGDGGKFIFNLSKSKSYEVMLMFSNRIQHLIFHFNEERGTLNKLPYQQDIWVRIACHAGELIYSRDPGNIHGDALNNLCHYEKEVGVPGYIVISHEVYRHLPTFYQERCEDHKVCTELGQTYIVDGKDTVCKMQFNDKQSSQLQQWITDAITVGNYKQLLYFSYTNERLKDLLLYQLPEINVKILTRNWVVEENEESIHNRALIANVSRNQDSSSRAWRKAYLIKGIASQLLKDLKLSIPEKKIEIRFYDSPPLFNGAILLNENDEGIAHVGVSKWEKPPKEGGSIYKLTKWPAFCLDSKDYIQARMIEYLKSRFEENWVKGLSYEEVCKMEETENRAMLEQVWSLDGKEYLIVCPHRKLKANLLPIVTYEDTMAVNTIERFLHQYRIRTKIFQIRMPEQYVGEWFPKEESIEIDNWPGHVMYICSKSLPTSLLSWLNEQNFPFEICNIGQEQPKVYHKKTGVAYFSPTDSESPEYRDYAVIAKFERLNRNSFGYIIAGIRAMGTWGAATFFTSKDGIRQLAELCKTKQFGALIEAKFDHEYPHGIVETSLITAPETF
ncbi:MAG: hypothetical protein A2Y62_10445 [Candidatus Fischerbacteria bacterium RBG_13_37_8]|uniref:Uncharacterized protein n=1 Tax=Candidatus Fischerbacteria bacterium RBG_13_37_8 TaxID=1817863 RepID=A0A1F5V7Z9_9BACT|nr:MAG: hypothetical protein A2Y62_10445 [Candidatus Fischerbacteria bacterium RBG_13_37_8]